MAHAHEDLAAIEALQRALPPWTRLDIFNDPNWAPAQSVSPEIVSRILAAGGLIFPDSPLSALSEWAFFEREYALLASKPIFQFHHATTRISRWSSRPLDLAVFPSYTHKDFEVLAPLLAMLNERFFDCWTNDLIVAGSEVQHELVKGMESRLDRGGYFLYFCTPTSSDSAWCQAELRHAAQHRDLSGRVLFVLVGGSPPPVEVNAAVFDLNPRPESSLAWLADALVVRLYKLIAGNETPRRPRTTNDP